MSIGNTRRATTLLTFIANDVTTATKTGSVVDLQDYEGDIALSLDAEAGSSGVTYAVKLTECDTTDGTYTDLSGAAFTTTDANTALVEQLVVNSDKAQRFIKCVVTVAGGTGTGAISVLGLAAPKYG
tara:strand:- start:5083 stop:5463 length:381 start_codon:yes stop_codon:yes gene_type:complete